MKSISEIRVKAYAERDGFQPRLDVVVDWWVGDDDRKTINSSLSVTCCSSFHALDRQKLRTLAEVLSALADPTPSSAEQVSALVDKLLSPEAYAT